MTPVPLCPPDQQEICEWVVAFLSAYGWLTLIGIVLVLIAGGALWWLFGRVTKVAGEKTEKIMQEVVEEGEKKGARAEAAGRYLRAVVEDYRFVKFRGGGARARGIEPPELDQVYVSLRMTPEANEEKRLQFAASKNVATGAVSTVERMVEPVSLAEAIGQSSRLAIVGVAGSGKSTLLQWAGLACARTRLNDPKLTGEQRSFVAAFGTKRPPLPVLLPLREYNRYCVEKILGRNASTLLEFLSLYIAREHPTLDLPPDFFARALDREGDGCLLMFDGVDEVATDDRQFVREAIEDLLASASAENLCNRCLLTSRTYAYLDAAVATDFHECRVQNLEPEERDRLIHSWYATVYPAERAGREANDLCVQIAASDRRVQDLAVTPLMTTIFCLVHYDGGRLPRHRAALYERAVNILLTESEFKEGEAVKDLAQWGGYSPDQRRNKLARIAFAMHDLPGQQGDSILEDDLLELERVWRAFGVEKAPARETARAFIQLAADRGGLLERENNRYGFFTHRTFREFLAGRYLAEELSDDWRAVLTQRFHDTQWREAILLAAGYLAINGESRANTFVRLLAELGLTPEENAETLTLAALAWADLPVEANTPLDPQRLETRDLLAPQLLDILTANPPRVEARLRRDVGLALAGVGDPRFPSSPDAVLPEKGLEGEGLLPTLITIPVGEFRMGTSDEEAEQLKAQNAEVWDDEKPQHTVFVSEFQIGRYAVTNAEFRAFVDAEGYNPDAPWWEGDARLWRRGELKPNLSIYAEETRKDVEEWLERRPVEKRHQPFFWDDPQRNADNLPVVGVTWYEAEAYCKWLRTVTGQPFRLPAEAEWEKTARGPQGSLWPWGNEWDVERCNSEESKLGATTPVGMYPHGAAQWPDGPIEDLIGNVWEWCSDWWQADVYQQRQEKAVRDPTGPDSGSARVVRGGSYFYSRRNCRSACRNWFEPFGFSVYFGFRVARSP